MLQNLEFIVCDGNGARLTILPRNPLSRTILLFPIFRYQRFLSTEFTRSTVNDHSACHSLYTLFGNRRKFFLSSFLSFFLSLASVLSPHSHWAQQNAENKSKQSEFIQNYQYYCPFRKNISFCCGWALVSDIGWRFWQIIIHLNDRAQRKWTST